MTTVGVAAGTFALCRCKQQTITVKLNATGAVPELGEVSESE